MLRTGDLETTRREFIREAGGCMLAGNDERAFSLLNTALHLIDNSMALCDADIAECLTLMGSIKLKSDEPEAAESYLRLAHFVYQRCDGDVTSNIAQLMPLLVLACRRQGQFARARRLERHLRSQEAENGEDTLHRINTSEYTSVLIPVPDYLATGH